MEKKYNIGHLHCWIDVKRNNKIKKTIEEVLAEVKVVAQGNADIYNSEKNGVIIIRAIGEFNPSDIYSLITSSGYSIIKSSIKRIKNDTKTRISQ